MLGGNRGMLLPVNTVAVEQEPLLLWKTTESSVYFGHSNVWGGTDPRISLFLFHPQQVHNQKI